MRFQPLVLYFDNGVGIRPPILAMPMSLPAMGFPYVALGTPLVWAHATSGLGRFEGIQAREWVGPAAEVAVTSGL